MSKLVEPFSYVWNSVGVEGLCGNKILGPDGFNLAFVKKFWFLLKEKVNIMFDQFYGNKCVPNGSLSYFVATILSERILDQFPY